MENVISRHPLLHGNRKTQRQGGVQTEQVTRRVAVTEPLESTRPGTTEQTQRQERESIDEILYAKQRG